MQADKICPCGGPGSYALCCGVFHSGAAAPTAEALMRSRYCAYSMRDDRYLLATWHPSTRPDAIDFGEEVVKWLGLEVKECWQDGDDRAGVEFVARYKVGGEKAHRLHERSRFALEEGRWYYLDDELAEQL